VSRTNPKPSPPRTAAIVWFRDSRNPNLGRNLTPQQRKERTFDLLIGGLAIRAREVPVLMVFEDAHWMDPTTLTPTFPGYRDRKV
jgi:hypothetical protein